MTREEAIKRLKEIDIRDALQEDYDALYMAIKALEKEPKTGHWINAKVGKLFPSNDYKCSECGNILDFDGVNCGRGDANFCPNCGADMRETESEDKVDNEDT